MKGPGVVTCLCWLLANVGLSVQTLPEAAGHSLTYVVETSTLAGAPELANQYSGQAIYYEVNVHAVSKNKVVFKIHDVRTGKLNEELPVSYEDDIDFQLSPSPIYERELSKPFSVHFEDFQVTKITTQASDPVWSVNIKKALADKFQVDLKKKGSPVSWSRSNRVPKIDPSSSVYTTYEEGIGGDCETRYSILSVPSLDHPNQSESVLNITKVKNFRNCRSRPIIETDNFQRQGSPIVCEPKYSPLNKRQPAVWRESSSVYESGCHFGFEPDHHPVWSSSLIKYNISYAAQFPIIEDISAEGKTFYSLYGKELLIVVKQNITLLKKAGLRSQVPQIPNPVVHPSIEYEFPVEKEMDTPDARLYALFGPQERSDLVSAIDQQLEAVVSDIIPDDPETSQNVGPKLIQLVDAITVLKRPELEEVFKQIESDNDQKSDRKEELKRKILLDILAISASDEAALFVRDLFVSQRIKPWEAVEVFEGIGKNIDDPSDKVIEAYFKLLERPRVQQNRLLVSPVAITLGKMINEACVSDDDPPAPQRHKDAQQPQAHGPRHPRSLNRDSSEESSQEIPKKHPRDPKPKKPQEDDEECSREELQSYIKAIAQKLREAKRVNRMIIWIEALAHMGTPDVLPYIKPYVTGEAPNLEPLEDEDADFLQSAAIYALHHLVVSSTDEILPIVSNIYFDQSEDYEIRIAAFSVLIATQPPLSLLERVMTELHDENNNQVGSYVYSLCSEIANSSMPYERKLAQKLQLVLPHAPDFDIGDQYSSADIYSFYDDDDDYGLKYTTTYVASNVSTFPRSIFHSMKAVRGPFRVNIFKVGGTLKGVDELLEKMFQPGGIATQIVSSLGSNVQVRNIPEVLDVVKSRLLFKDHDVDIPRAFLYYKLFGRTTYLTLDEQYLTEVLEQALEFLRKIDITSGFSANYAKVWMPASFIRAIPSPVGLPVVVSHRIPVVLTAFLGNSRVATNGKKEAPLTSTIAVSTDLHVSLHVSSIALASVFDPANDQIHGVALEKTTELALASEIEVAVDLQKDTYALSIKPKLPHEIFYHDTRPSTYIQDAVIIGQPKEEWLDQVNEIETIPEPFKFDERYEGRALGLSMRVTGDSESPWADIALPLTDTADEDGIVAALYETWVNPEMINRELHVYLEPHRHSPASEIVFTLDYDKHLKLGLPKSVEESDESDSSEEEDYDKVLSSIYGRGYSVPDAQDTIQKLVQKTQAAWAPVLGQAYEDPVPATVTHVVEATMAIKGQHTKQHAWRGVYAHSLDFRSNWFQVFGHRSSDEYQRPWQFCSSAVVVYPQMPNPFYLEMNTLKSQKVKIEAEAGWGSDCQSQNQIRVEGSMEKSEQQLTSSSGVYESEKDQQSLPWYYKQCEVDRTEGQTQSYACQQAISEDSQLNVIQLDIIAPSLPEYVQNLTYQADLYAKYAWYPNLEATPFVSNPDDRVSIFLHYSNQVPEIPLLDIEVKKPSETLVFSKLYVPDYEPPSTLDSYDEVYMDQYYDDDYVPECNLMEDYLSTFDNVTIELPDNKCQYILAHDSSPDKAFSIIASQIDLEAKTKALSMALAGHSIKALPPRGEAVPVVLNGKQHEVTPQTPIVLGFEKETELRIYVLSTSSSTDTPILVVEAWDDDIAVQYDGKNARIQLPREYQGDQVGMCGDFNDEQFHEFTGPNGCVYVEEEDFANSYAIPGQSCTSPPKPKGPAFCPDDVVEVQEKHQNDQSSEETKDSHPRPKPKVIPRSRTAQSEESDEVAPPPPHRVVPKPTKKPIKPAQSESEEEDDKPDGPEECIQVYTPTFEDKQSRSTCFATQQAYKCRQGCRAVHPKTKQMPFHCLPESKYEKILKEQAKNSFVHMLQNKKPEKFREVDIPEKCL